MLRKQPKTQVNSNQCNPVLPGPLEQRAIPLVPPQGDNNQSEDGSSFSCVGGSNPPSSDSPRQNPSPPLVDQNDQGGDFTNQITAMINNEAPTAIIKGMRRAIGQEILPETGKSKIELLPIGLIGQIFSHLHLQELGRGCLVSKEMKRKLTSDINRKWWNKAFLERYAFGAQKWAMYFGNVGVEPRLPENIIEILKSQCPFFANQRVMDTHVLVLIPMAVGGEALTLNKLKELIRNPRNNGHATHYNYYNHNIQYVHGDTGINQSYWVLMTKEVIPGSRSKNYNEQKELVRQHEGVGYTLPGALEAAVCILMEYVVSSKKLFSAYMRCSEIDLVQPVLQFHVTVGDFGSDGLVVNIIHDSGRPPSCGVGALRKFF